MIKKFTIFTFCLFLINNYIIAKDSTSNKYYFLNANIGADLARGVKIGILFHLQEHFSLEASYGRDIINYILPSDQDKRYSIGANWHKGNMSNLICSIYFTHSVFPSGYIKRQNIISASIGSFIINKDRIRFYYKGGILIGFKKNNDGNKSIIFPNVDIGIGLNLF